MSAPTADQLHELSRSAYYAIVRAIYASGRLDDFDNEMLLTDLQTSLGIKVDEHIAYVEQVHKDEEATRLAAYGDLGEARGNPSAVPPARTIEMPRVMSMQAPPSIMVPNYSTPFQGQAFTPASSSKPRVKKEKPSGSNLAPSASGRVIKSATTVKKIRPKANPLSPKSAQGKGSKAQMVNPHMASLFRLDQINQRERIIFSGLIAMGAKEDDPDLNDVHRALLKWYRADARQQEIIQLLARTA